MLFDKTVMIGMGIVIAIYILYKLFYNTSQYDNEYDVMYNKILNSEEYKVKSQHDK